METERGTSGERETEQPFGLRAAPSRSGRVHWLLPVAGVCLVMGALLAVQIRTYESAAMAMGSRPFGPVFGLLATARDRLQQQTEQIEDLQAKLTRYENAAASHKEALLNVMNNELQAYKTSLGLTKVKGPGIVLTLDDSTFRLGDSGDKELQQLLLVHSSDLLQIANELWAAGAEAVAIGGQRVTANTPIRCVGPVVHVNAVPVASPYVISAIGDPNLLTSALNLRGGVLDTMRSLKYKVKLIQEDEIILPAVTVQPKLKLAQTIVEDEEPSR